MIYNFQISLERPRFYEIGPRRPKVTRDEYETFYGDFALSLLADFKSLDPSFPDIALTIGDELMQISRIKHNGYSGYGRIIEHQGKMIIGESLPCINRDPTIDIERNLLRIINSENSFHLNIRHADLKGEFEKFAIIDLTKRNDVFRFPPDTYFHGMQPTEWGLVGQFKKPAADVFYINNKTAFSKLRQFSSQDYNAKCLMNEGIYPKEIK